MTLLSSAAPEGHALEMVVASDDALDVRHFSVHERISSLFEATVVVMSGNAAIDFDAVVGQPAGLSLRAGSQVRTWAGICSQLHQVGVEEEGLSTYQITLVPDLWLATQRRNYRIFQQLSEPDIVLQLLAEWGIEPEVRLTGVYKKRKYRVQYAESDYAFMSRMLEDAGISFYFAPIEGGTRLVLSDAPHFATPRQSKLPFKDDISMESGEYATRLRIGQRVRPGRYTMRDHDYRRASSNQPLSSAEAANVSIEKRLERFHYTPGAFLFGTDRGDDTPSADDRGKARTDEGEAALLSQKRLEAKRASAKTCTFDTNAPDLAPGMVLSLLDHPRPDLGPDRRLLVVEMTHSGTFSSAWSHACEVRSADVPFRPALTTPRPKAIGVESATVVGPAGEEIHTDEFGRVRVHFHWDRESAMDDRSSCWIHVSQPWGGAGFGGTNLPRVGQEVLVEFLGGDPDRPVIVGRLYTNLQKVPYKLPENKTQSGWKSNSTGKTGGYNELMFEDASGSELLRMQAERDLKKLVKNDESVTIGNDRTKEVGHDDLLRVVNDRSRQVGNDESITIGSNRSKTVGGDEDAQVGGNRSQVVGMNKSSQVGGHQDEQVGGNDSLSVGKNMSVQVQLAKTETVGIASAETVGVTKVLQAGKSYEIQVGKTMNVAVGESQSESIGVSKKVVVGEVYELSCGASSIHVDAGGNVTITASDIVMKSSGPVLVEAGGVVKVMAGGAIKVQGSTVDIN
ncbi:type VI secretion system Vgr family protein [Chondromyces crocatus]|uniref:type VI secretion system Vgr family protein n=1 Tax=Chondromyces crocatus TaxID=52 RepID=UPI001FE10A12|nr:type VI secretion system tip protein TssI/VgrG [Chondromyces crocatus]